MRLLPRSISLRLTVALSVIALFVFAAADMLLHHTLARELAQASHAELRGKIAVVRHFVDEARTTGDVDALRHRLDDLLTGHDEFRVWLQSAGGRVTYGGPPPTVVERLAATVAPAGALRPQPRPAACVVSRHQRSVHLKLRGAGSPARGICNSIAVGRGSIGAKTSTPLR